MELMMLGAGGHARSVADAMVGPIAAVVLLRTEQGHHHGELAPVVIYEDELLGYPIGSIRIVNGIGKTAPGGSRSSVFQTFRAAGFVFETAIHQTAYVSRSATLGHGVQVLAGAIVGPGARLGDNTIVNTGALVEHACDVGAHVHLASGTVLCGDVIVGQDSMIGAGATVTPGVSIGSSSQVGAGAVVVRSVPDHELVLGVPAKVHR